MAERRDQLNVRKQSGSRSLAECFRDKFGPKRILVLSQVTEPVIVERRWHTTPKMRVPKRDGRF